MSYAMQIIEMSLAACAGVPWLTFSSQRLCPPSTVPEEVIWGV
jgi:hypothetical protein